MVSNIVTQAPPVLLSSEEGSALSVQAEQTSEVALALMDALALWAYPVQESFAPPPPPTEKLTYTETEKPKERERSEKAASDKKIEEGHREQERGKAPSVAKESSPPSPKPGERTPSSSTSSNERDRPSSKEPLAKTSTTSSEQLFEAGSRPPQERGERAATPPTFKESNTKEIQREGREREQVYSKPIFPLTNRLPQSLTKDFSRLDFPPEQERQGGDSKRQKNEEGEGRSGTSSTAKKVNEVARKQFKSSASIHPPSPLHKCLAEKATELSEFLGRRVTHFDVLLLFIELMKLEITSQEQDKLSRRAEREMQLNYLEKEVANFKSQSNWLLFSYVGAGLLGIVSGIAPIIGHTHGESILGTLSSISNRFEGMRKKEFFDGVSKITMAMSDTQKGMGQIYSTAAEGKRTRYNRMGDIHRSDQEEMTRSVELLQERFRQSERFLIDLLQMRHDVTSQLYR